MSKYTKRSATPKTVAEFETAHGQPRIKRLQHELEVERAKVEALADVQHRVCVERSASNTVTFGLTGDRHTGSLYSYPDALAAFYEYAGKQGATVILDCGDILAGHRVYKGQEFELRDLGLDAQLDRLAKDAPRGIKTRFITGNHDASFKTAAGAPVGKLIAQAVPEYEFVGEEQARVRFETPAGSLDVMLTHPGGGAKAYALSYPLQQHIGALEGGTKPDLYAAGHYHKAAMLPSYRNVCGVLAGTFERQTPFMARNGLAAHVGGWVISVAVGNGHHAIRGEFVAFYV